jgi:hypothetical protein
MPNDGCLTIIPTLHWDAEFSTTYFRDADENTPDVGIDEDIACVLPRLDVCEAAPL